MRHYKHLTRYERENLLFLRAKGYSITAIAESMGRNKELYPVSFVETLLPISICQ